MIRDFESHKCLHEKDTWAGYRLRKRLSGVGEWVRRWREGQWPGEVNAKGEEGNG